MALNKAVFKTRALTAMVFAVVMMAGLLWSKWAFIALFTIIHFGCWWEYFKLTEKIAHCKIDIVVKYYFFLVGLVLLWYAAFPLYSFDFGIKIGETLIGFKYLFLGFLVLLMGLFLGQNKNISATGKWMCFAGFFYITMPVFMLINMRLMDTGYIAAADPGRILPCGIIFSIWINDTMAYIVGSLIGKTPFSKISPKKLGKVRLVVPCSASL